MTGLALLLALSPAVHANELKDAFVRSANRHHVPVVLLEVVAWEATRWDPDANTVWHGYGMMDLMEGEQHPSVERAAILLDVSPDLLIRDWRWNIDGAAALLENAARNYNHGVLPPQEDLRAWWDAARVFAKSDDPAMQDWYLSTIFGAVNAGVGARTDWGIYTTKPTEVVYDDLAIVMPPNPTEPDYDGAARFTAAASCNYSDYSRSGSDIWYVVVHVMQGSYNGSISWFQNCDAGASAHYMIRSSDGEITQMVKEEDVGWHAANWDYNLHSIGLEHEGYIDDPDTWFTDVMYRSSAALVSDIVSRTSVKADRSHIVGHDEVPGATHTDPGAYWDWDYYMSLITGGSSTPTGDILGVVALAGTDYATRIPNATVWTNTGETTTADGDGNWGLYDLPTGDYHVYAKADGYLQGECWRGGFSLASGDQLYCSVELTPDESDTDTDADADSDTDSDTDSDSDSDTDAGSIPPPSDTQVAMEGGGCGCSPMGGVGSLLPSLLGLLGLARRRR